MINKLKYTCALEGRRRPPVVLDIINKRNGVMRVALKGFRFNAVLNPDATVDLITDASDDSTVDHRRIRVGLNASITNKRK